MPTKKFGTGGNVTYTFGGKGQANKQRTRGGSVDGYQKEVPDVNNNKYAGMKAGGLPAAINKQKTHHTAGGVPNFANKAFKKGGETMKTEAKKEMREEMKVDTAQDKKMIKKAFSMHDKQEHKGGKTNLSKLCGGGAMKAKKMATGGKVKSSSGINGIAQKGHTKGKVC